jgi:hypothetical protein
MNRILLITSTLPWPLRRNGGGQRTALLRRALSKWGEVDVLAIGGMQLVDDNVTEAMLRENGITKCILRQPAPRPSPWYAIGPLAGMHDLLENWRDRFRPDALATQWLRQQPRYDLIVGRYLAAAMQGGVGTDAAGDVPAALDFDDMEWQTLEAQLVQNPWPGLKGKLGAAMALREVRRICISSLRLFNHLWVTSEEDAALLPPEAPAHSVLPNIPFNGEDANISGEGQPGEVLFVGDLQLPANRDGLEKFLALAWPHVREAVPDAKLRIVGRGLSDDQRARWSQIAGVDVIGFAPDLRACYERTAICIVPVFFGGGTKIKVLEALLHSRPVVTTEHAMRGYVALNADGPAALAAFDVNSFAEGCIMLLRDPARRREMGERGRAIVQRVFSYDRFQSVVDEALAPLLQMPAQTITTPTPVPQQL